MGTLKKILSTFTGGSGEAETCEAVRKKEQLPSSEKFAMFANMEDLIVEFSMMAFRFAVVTVTGSAVLLCSSCAMSAMTSSRRSSRAESFNNL